MAIDFDEARYSIKNGKQDDVPDRELRGITRQFLDELVRQYSLIADYQDACLQKREIINGQGEEIARLREALEFYSNEENYHYQTDETPSGEPIDFQPVIEDLGKIAREALNPNPKGEPK